MNCISRRPTRLMSVALVLFGLACAQAPVNSGVILGPEYYLQLASHHRQEADGYRKRSLQHRGGRFHSRREHNRLLALAEENDREATRFEKLAEELQSAPEGATATPE